MTLSKEDSDIRKELKEIKSFGGTFESKSSCKSIRKLNIPESSNFQKSSRSFKL